ncbi:MAG TPA: SagB/ThcOx family dehydrogenase [Dissulfurispiraceae bacterium]|nr:SagB/ThcOx family dehydrogenase [Dissulfurispiraceae bacterium]
MKIQAETVFRYHEETKHHPRRYARAAGYMDWANEPHPFRVYHGSTLIPLPFTQSDPDAEYIDLLERKRNILQPVSLESISKFLELSLGLSAWKAFGESSWALRMNPSSGNLHPTEAHLILPPLSDVNNCAGIYHYNPYFHAIEQRALIENALWSYITKLCGAEGFFIGLSTIYWRESWKYGERAFRYCNLDIGHAMACLSIAGNLLGWKVTYLDYLSSNDIETMLGFQKTEWPEFERERPEMICFVNRGTADTTHSGLTEGIVGMFESIRYDGKPNRLSAEHQDWRIVEEVSSATEKPRTSSSHYNFSCTLSFAAGSRSIKAVDIIRKRRSATAFDTITALSKKDFIAILDMTVPRHNCAPFDMRPFEPCIALFIFVHRIDGLDSGLYCLVRNNNIMRDLKRSCHSEFIWQRVDGMPEYFDFYLLHHGDYRDKASNAGCYQEIAGDGILSAAMIARFRNDVELSPHYYRSLHWEAGMIGQMLYLAAEACGMRGTAMGCFFDDIVHDMIGLSDDTFQDLYHFSIGKQIEDKRLTTLLPYYHLSR